MKVAAPAKLNLSLRIGERFENGFHAIESEMIKISLTDILEFSVSEKEQEGEIFLTIKNSTDTDLTISPEKNLVIRAVRAFFSHFFPGKKMPNCSIILHKNIPIGAGLGGGSSDAAATILFLTQFFSVSAKTQTLLDLGASLGSDIPFFLTPFLRAQISSRGEKIAPLPSQPPRSFLLVRPRGQIISSGEMFREWDDWKEKKDQKNFSNDFEPLAFERFPELQKTAERLRKNGAEKVGLSGSGAVIFGIFSNEPLTQTAQRAFPKNDFWSAKTQSLELRRH